MTSFFKLITWCANGSRPPLENIPPFSDHAPPPSPIYQNMLSYHVFTDL